MGSTDIPGFEWQDRHAFVASQLDADEPVSDDGSKTQETPDQPVTDIEGRLAEVEQALNDCQARIDALEQPTGDEQPVAPSPIDPDLFAKIVRACLADDRISEDEEELIINALR